MNTELVGSSPTLVMLKKQQQKQDFESDRIQLEQLATLRRELQEALSKIQQISFENNHSDTNTETTTTKDDDNPVWLSSRNSSFFRVEKKEQIQPILENELKETEDEILELCQTLQKRMDEE